MRAVPALKSWPRTALPSAIPASEARALVAGCDTATGRGRRDAAVLLILVRLGLRAAEVARLELEDIDWRRGEVTIRGKGGRGDVLPLPVEVGEAIVAYLRDGRPSSSSRAVFLTALAPIRPLSSDGVALVVRRACGRAGVSTIGPHRLRHTLATETLHAGAPMAEVAQLLRHVDQATSSIYAGRRRVRGGGARQPVAGGAAMSESTLGLAVQDYLRLRRSFGYVLAGQDRPLADFAHYLDLIGLDTVTVEAALAWAVESGDEPAAALPASGDGPGVRHLSASHRPAL